MPGKKLGRECYLYRNTGTYANAVWNTVAEVIDLNYKDAAAKGDVSSRSSSFKKYRQGLRDLSATFGLRYNSADDDFTYLKSAYANGALTDFWVADGLSNTTNTTGPRFWAQVIEFSHDQPLEDGVKVNVEICPCNDTSSTEEPTTYTAS